MRLSKLIPFFLGLVIFLSCAFLLEKHQSDNFPELAELQSNDWNFNKLSQFFSKLALKKGAVYAYQLLGTAPIPPNIDMHLMGHVVGDILYKQKGIEGITNCTQDFRNACSHSIVVGYLLDHGEASLPLIAETCKKAPGGSGAYTMCFHGLGHGVLAYAGYDLEEAVNLCEKTGTKEYNFREGVECIGGAIMEIIGGGFHDPELWAKQSKKYLSKDNPLYPCSASFMPENARSQCYVYLTPHLFVAAGADLGSPQPSFYQKAFNFCNSIPDSQMGNKDACYGGFGKEFLVLAKERDIRSIDKMTEAEMQKVYSWCGLAKKDEAELACVNSAASSMYWGGENSKETVIKFCSLATNKIVYESCFDNLTGAVAFYIQDKTYKESYCAEIPQALRDKCRARLSIN